MKFNIFKFLKSKPEPKIELWDCGWMKNSRKVNAQEKAKESKPDENKKRKPN